ncbi:MAG: ComEC/Rec2 family competence protein [Planctomycetota bacterium]
MDPIQRQLKLIDERLDQRHSVAVLLTQKAPLLTPAIGVIAGIVIQNRFNLHIIQPLCALALSTVVICALTIIPLTRRSVFPVLSAIFVCFTTLGMVRLISYKEPENNDICHFLTESRILSTIRGTLITEPYINQNKNWKFARFIHTGSTSSFYLKLCQARTDTLWRKASGTIRIRVGSPAIGIHSGDYIEAYCWIQPPAAAKNPGQFNLQNYLAQRNVHTVAFIESADGIKVLNTTVPGYIEKLKAKVRQIASNALLGGLQPEDENEAMLQALLLGVRTNIPADAERAFRETGLLHFISLSGLHVGILLAIVWRLCRTAGLLKVGRAVVCLIVLGLFIVIVPARSPIIRAAIIGAVFCAAYMFSRRPHPLNSLALAAIILLMLQPFNLFAVGWQLSFATVLGILLFEKPIEGFFHRLTVDSFNNGKKHRSFGMDFIKSLGNIIIQMLSVSLAAWIGGAGILLYHFYCITPFASLWTVMVFPFVAMVLTFGFIKMILALVLPTASLVLGAAARLTAAGLIRFVELIAGLGISEILVGSIPLSLVLLYYALILLMRFFHPRRRFLRTAACVGIAIILSVSLFGVKWRQKHRDYLAVNCLAVGHGQAILVEMPEGSNILFDAGSVTQHNCGAAVVVPFLRSKGLNAIETLFISHNDIDHINGIPEIAALCKVNTICANKAFFCEKDQWGTREFLRKCLAEQGLSIQSAEHLRTKSCVKTRILWPDVGICPLEQLSENDRSQVTLMEFAGRKILLCSDIEKFAQEKLIETYPDLRLDVIIAPHHGSEKTLHERFISTFQSAFMIFSCSQRDYENYAAHPKTNTTKCYYTCCDGVVRIRINADGTIKTSTFSRP